MTICRGCGGVAGRDCFNPEECEWIANDMHRREQNAQADDLHALRADRDRLAAEVVRLTSLVTWQPIESAPKDGTSVLLGHSGYAQAFYDRDHKPRIWVDFFNRGGWYSTAPSAQPTHWMPLPTALAEQQTAGERA